jgi:hypothetical protein
MDLRDKLWIQQGCRFSKLKSKIILNCIFSYSRCGLDVSCVSFAGGKEINNDGTDIYNIYIYIYVYSSHKGITNVMNRITSFSFSGTHRTF